MESSPAKFSPCLTPQDKYRGHKRDAATDPVSPRAVGFMAADKRSRGVKVSFRGSRQHGIAYSEENSTVTPPDQHLGLTLPTKEDSISWGSAGTDGHVSFLNFAFIAEELDFSLSSVSVPLPLDHSSSVKGTRLNDPPGERSAPNVPLAPPVTAATAYSKRHHTRAKGAGVLYVSAARSPSARHLPRDSLPKRGSGRVRPGSRVSACAGRFAALWGSLVGGKKYSPTQSAASPRRRAEHHDLSPHLRHVRRTNC